MEQVTLPLACKPVARHNTPTAQVKLIHERLRTLRGTAPPCHPQIGVNRCKPVARHNTPTAQVKLINERLRTLRGTARLAVDLVQPIRPEMARAFQYAFGWVGVRGTGKGVGGRG